MKNYLFLLIVAVIFYLFLKISNRRCGYFDEIKGTVWRKFIVKSDYAYELQTNKGIKNVYKINEEVDKYLMEGDSIYKKEFGY